MPLHEWTDRQGWDGVRQLWIVELLYWIKPRLPAGYRAYIGTAPTMAVGAAPERPDVSLRQWTEAQTPPSEATVPAPEPDEEIAVATIDPGTAIYVEREGRLTAVVELVSPRNKDRPVARATYLGRYVGYLLEGVHLLLVDVYRRPPAFSFADQIAHELQLTQPPLPSPLAVGYRVGEPAATGGRFLAVWRRPLAVGAPCLSWPCRSPWRPPSPSIWNRPIYFYCVSDLIGRKSLAYKSSWRTTLLTGEGPWNDVFAFDWTNCSTMPRFLPA